MNIYYRRFGYKSTKRFYWCLRIDYISHFKISILIKKRENSNWDLNRLLRQATMIR